MAAHSAARRRRRRNSRILTVVALSLAAATTGGCASGPPYDQLLSGDEELIAIAREGSTQARDRVALALIDGDDVRTAFVSADAGTGFGLGGATRGLTGLLLADAVERGEVSLDDAVGAHLDLGDAPAATLTLRDLATNRSGLPQDPLGAAAAAPAPGGGADAVDRGGLAALLDEVAAVDLVPELEYNPSDFAAALVGQAVASAAGARFADLLAERVFAPAGMTGAVVVESGALTPDGLAQGHDRRGERVAARGSGAYAPAVGVVVDLDDAVALARAILDGPFAGSAALAPIADTRWPQISVGLFWEQVESDSAAAVYVVGSAEGFTAAILADPEAGRAVALLSNAEVAWPWSRLRPLVDLLGG
ncbi:serine hydrolase domain-containing protein [Agromyces sp. SYSU T0242]|uniref:serine hydrolase domain-containing protein n=1 Tax=Agromyces litoreus TaxID=3158561 RepID=UPI0033949A33